CHSFILFFLNFFFSLPKRKQLCVCVCAFYFFFLNISPPHIYFHIINLKNIFYDIYYVLVWKRSSQQQEPPAFAFESSSSTTTNPFFDLLRCNSAPSPPLLAFDNIPTYA